MIKVTAKIDGVEKTSDEFKQARREIYRRTRTGMKRAGERTILPAARASTAVRTPLQGSQVVVKSTASYAYLTGQTVKAGRILGYLNYGGYLKPVQPKKRRKGAGGHAPAVAFGGIVVARTKRMRHHTGTHFLEKARDAGFPQYERVLLEHLMASFDPLEHTP